MRRLVFSALLALTVITASGKANATCFDPLSDPQSRDPQKFKDIAERNPTIKSTGVLRIQTITTGKGPANIDYLYLNFTPKTGTALPEMFKDLRLHFSDFARGVTKKFAFGPYGAKLLGEDKVMKANLEKWQSNDPVGALMSFNLDAVGPLAGRMPNPKAGTGRLWLLEKAGDVLVTCSSPTDFVFSTVESEWGGMHPVAGHRGFGLKANADGTWTFYSKGSDRDSGSKLNAIVNRKKNGVFCAGHDFWILFFAEIKTYLNLAGMIASEPNLKNHGPVDYPPFPSGEQPALDCSKQPQE